MFMDTKQLGIKLPKHGQVWLKIFSINELIKDKSCKTICKQEKFILFNKLTNDIKRTRVFLFFVSGFLAIENFPALFFLSRFSLFWCKISFTAVVLRENLCDNERKCEREKENAIRKSFFVCRLLWENIISNQNFGQDWRSVKISPCSFVERILKEKKNFFDFSRF